ncbi:MAG: response regulator, partial [Spirochaetales bacterium]|nr:response regulator [Spirochaetales bacterium]
IDKHSGFINVKSVKEKGTSFLIYLPVTGSGGISRSPEEKIKKNTKSFSVLVMDDEETIRDILTIMLQQMGHTVTTVEEGKAAVAEYKKSVFDLVILDITIPGGMGGTETMKQLLDINPRVKAVISSGYANSPVMSDYKKYGFYDTLTKPYLMTELEALVKKVLY